MSTPASSSAASLFSSGRDLLLQPPANDVEGG